MSVQTAEMPGVRQQTPERLEPGTRIGSFEVAEFIGAGGMGEVYRAHDLSLDRIVALKLLPPDLAGDPERVRRFEEEARAASALSHPAIVTVYGAGQIGRRAFISMELVAGETLRDLLRNGALPLRRALHIATQIAEGLTVAHDARLVHRDLKPENIKVSPDGFAKILDFGLAKRARPHVGDAEAVTAFETVPGTVLGTAGYMAPEQAAGGRAEFTADQFAFGALLYEMLTGRRAFDRTTIGETLSAIIREEPTPIAQINPSIPAPLRWIVERCLAKEPSDRYALTRDLARDLASARDHLAELSASRRLRAKNPQSGPPALAVLPVLDMSTPAQPEMLADTMTDALITAMSQCGSLRVLSRVSSLAYKGRRSPLPDIADDLGVDWVLVASIAKAGHEVRINAQLVDASRDENHWAHSFTRPARKMLSVQTEVATEIATMVQAAVAGNGAAPRD